MRRDYLLGFFIFLFIVAHFLFLQSKIVEAGVTGACANCHTMHNSQGAVEDNETAQEHLLKIKGDGDCLGCHAAPAGEDEYKVEGAPQVIYYDADDKSKRMLAGGTFTTVKDNDGDGHNIVKLTGKDDVIKVMPGDPDCVFKVDELACAGTKGCHGDRDIENPMKAIQKGHHSPADAYRDGHDLAHSYRMLNGVAGIGAVDYEFGMTNKLIDKNKLGDPNINVNIYQGEHLDWPNNAPSGKSISWLCGECHGNKESDKGFYSRAGIVSADNNDIWIRHPTDIITKLDNYPNVGEENKYSTEVPLGFVDAIKGADFNPEASGVTVTCLSCHRAHGSQYKDALRFDYSFMKTGAKGEDLPDGEKGCFRCHTDKDFEE